MNTLYCAIYVRKSSEEGLEQDFNSLDAQREACEAFVLSQKTQGWKGSFHVIAVPVRLKQGNHAMRLVVRDQGTEAKTPDGALVALLARANHWFAAVRSGEHESIASLAAEQRQADRDITRTMYLAFLAPDIVETIARGGQPIGMGVRRLVAMSPLPMDWVEQRKLFGLT